MYKHIKDYDNDLEEEMQRRFQNAIYKAKKTNVELRGLITAARQVDKAAYPNIYNFAFKNSPIE